MSDRNQLVCDLYRQGKSMTGVARELGISDKAVQKILRDMGVPSRPRSYISPEALEKQSYPRDIKERALGLIAGGYSIRDAARLSGASEGSIRRWRDDAKNQQRKD